MPDNNYLYQLRTPTIEHPLRILFSACLLGNLCGTDGSSYGNHINTIRLSKYSNVKTFSFCPEEYKLGTPREIPDIKRGNGSDVLDGKSVVITESGKNVTKEMIEGAERMLEIALLNKIELAIMMDVSASCGSQVIYSGHRLSDDSKYQIGNGVAAALLKRNGVEIISQRDFKSLGILFSKLDQNYVADASAKDHHETDWYRTYFNLE